MNLQELLTVGAQVKLERERAGLTQAQLAEKAGVTQPLIAAIEMNYDVKLGSMQRVANALGAHAGAKCLSFVPGATAPETRPWKRTRPK